MRPRGPTTRRRARPPAAARSRRSSMHRLAGRAQRGDSALAHRRAPTTSTMPMPQLKIAHASRRRRRRRARAASRTRRHAASASASIRACTPSGSMRGTFSSRPPPVMCASALTRRPRGSASTGLHVDAGRRQQRVAERRPRCASNGSPQVRPCSRRGSGGPARSRWNVDARRCEADQHVADGDRSRPSMISASPRPRRRQSRRGRNSPAAYMPGHLGRLAADQRAAGQLAAVAMPCDRPPPRRRRRAGRYTK